MTPLAPAMKIRTHESLRLRRPVPRARAPCSCAVLVPGATAGRDLPPAGHKRRLGGLAVSYDGIDE